MDIEEGEDSVRTSSEDKSSQEDTSDPQFMPAMFFTTRNTPPCSDFLSGSCASLESITSNKCDSQRSDYGTLGVVVSVDGSDEKKRLKRKNQSSKLPSMADLVVQECSHFLKLQS
ncbi:hypothetical protein AHAS_Ahas03G0326600 [Arachis hypogaea]